MSGTRPKKMVILTVIVLFCFVVFLHLFASRSSMSFLYAIPLLFNVPVLAD